MEIVCKVGPISLQNNFLGLKKFSRLEMFLVTSLYGKGLVMETPKPDNFIELFCTFLGVSV